MNPTPNTTTSNQEVLLLCAGQSTISISGLLWTASHKKTLLLSMSALIKINETNNKTENKTNKKPTFFLLKVTMILEISKGF